MGSQTRWRQVARAMFFSAGLMVGTHAAGAETAVSIQYDFVSRPAWLIVASRTEGHAPGLASVCADEIDCDLAIQV